MNTNNSQAPFLRIKNEILSLIQEGKYGPNDKIPSENQLMKEHGVARMTANRALKELTEEGILTRVIGIGTFVSETRSEAHEIEVNNIADEIKGRGHTYNAKIVIHQEDKVTGKASRLLALPEGTIIFHTRLVHMEGKMPLQLEDRWVNPAIVPDYLKNDFQKITPTAFLLSKVPLQEVEHTIRAAMPPNEFSKLLCMPKKEPCLVLTRRTWLHKQVITFVRLYYPGSRYRLARNSTSKVSLEEF
ncbi:MAG: histidine utilization repressor [Sphingomonadales bacterium]